jgi:hypothetical protein
MGKKYNSSSVQANTTTEDSDISVTVDNQDITTEEGKVSLLLMIDVLELTDV